MIQNQSAEHRDGFLGHNKVFLLFVTFCFVFLNKEVLLFFLLLHLRDDAEIYIMHLYKYKILTGENISNMLNVQDVQWKNT